jgi:hypothetical protein
MALNQYLCSKCKPNNPNINAEECVTQPCRDKEEKERIMLTLELCVFCFIQLFFFVFNIMISDFFGWEILVISVTLAIYQIQCSYLLVKWHLISICVQNVNPIIPT